MGCERIGSIGRRDTQTMACARSSDRDRTYQHNCEIAENSIALEHHSFNCGARILAKFLNS